MTETIERTSALGLFNYARSYWRSAETLHAVTLHAVDEGEAALRIKQGVSGQLFPELCGWRPLVGSVMKERIDGLLRGAILGVLFAALIDVSGQLADRFRNELDGGADGRASHSAARSDGNP